MASYFVKSPNTPEGRRATTSSLAFWNFPVPRSSLRTPPIYSWHKVPLLEVSKDISQMSCKNKILLPCEWDRGDLARGWGRASCKNLSGTATELHTFTSFTCSCSEHGFSGICNRHGCFAGGRGLLRPHLKLVLTSVLSLALKLAGHYKGSQQPVANHLAKNE